MIPLVRPAFAEAAEPFIARLAAAGGSDHYDMALIEADEVGITLSGASGLLAIDGVGAEDVRGDVVLVDPRRGRVERLIRAASPHNTLLVTERCDQLCVMCSQPPKKTHVDRFDLLRQACLLAPHGMLIGVSGGEPTLYKEQLLGMIEDVYEERPDLSFHVLSNGQHFDEADRGRLARPAYRKVSWGVPLYSADADLHDRIVGKDGAFERLEETMATLIHAGSRVELRTVVMTDNVGGLVDLARYVASRLRFVEAWSIMQLEHIGYAKGRWGSLFHNHAMDFGPIGSALDHALLHGVRAQLFNFPRCTVPQEYRGLAIPSISDWKRKYAPACSTCTQRKVCTGFFEWHPDEEARLAATPL